MSIYFIAFIYHFSRDIPPSLMKNTARINHIINKINPVMLYLNDIIVVVSPLFVNTVHNKTMRTVVIQSIMLYFLSGNCSRKSCILFDWWYIVLIIIAKAPMIHISFHIQTIFQKIFSRPTVYVINVCAMNWNISPMKKTFIAVETIEAMFFFANMTMCIVVKIFYGNRGILNW